VPVMILCSSRARERLCLIRKLEPEQKASAAHIHDLLNLFKRSADKLRPSARSLAFDRFHIAPSVAVTAAISGSSRRRMLFRVVLP